MFDLGIPSWEIVLRSTVIYIAVVLVLRLTGRRSLGQRNTMVLVLVLIVANAVQNAMMGNDTSLIGGLVAAATLFLLDALIDRVTDRSEMLERFFSGRPVMLIKHD